MKRRAFLKLLAGAAAASPAAHPLSLRAQQSEKMRRIAALSGLAEGDPESRLRILSFEKGLRDLGWVKGRNLQIDYRWAGDSNELLKIAGDLVASKPELILTNSTPVAAAVREYTRTLPIVFVQVTDPVGQGFVASLARPGGNLTGITNFEFSIGSKWLETLREIVPSLARVGLVFNPNTAPFATMFVRPLEATAASLGISTAITSGRDAAELERAIVALANEPNSGLMVLPDVSTVNHRNEIIALARRLRLPAIYPYRMFALSGGLVSYGSDVSDIYRRVASYVDRVLRGTPPGHIPVEAPTKFELVINLKSARSIGLDVPQRLLTLADDVIE